MADARAAVKGVTDWMNDQMAGGDDFDVAAIPAVLKEQIDSGQIKQLQFEDGSLT